MPPNDVRRGRRRHSPPRESGAPPDLTSESAGEVQRGVIKWFNRDKGYGFIRCLDGEEVFVHESAVILGTNDLVLAKGREVEFEVRQTTRGNQAFSVVVLGEGAGEESDDDGNGRPAPRPTLVQPPAPTAPRAPSQPESIFDLSRKLPASWHRRPASFVYTYTIFGRRGD